MKVYISSANEQTADFRRAAIEACSQDGFPCELLCPERWGTTTRPPLGHCLAMVSRCDLFVFIWSPNLGTRLSDDMTITEREYREAVQQQRPVLALVPDEEKSPYSGSQMYNATPDARALLVELLDLQQGHVCAPFSSSEGVLGRLYGRVVAGHTSANEATLGEQPTAQKQHYVFGRYSLMTTRELVGRHEERQLLQEWGRGSDDSSAVPVMAIIAYGGTGKSALAWHWMREEVEGDEDVEAVVWFSFYEVGATFQDFIVRVASFLLGIDIEHARARVKVDGLDELQEEILDRLDRHHCVLVLDGLERILVGYSRLDAQRRDEAELDEATDNQFKAGRGRATVSGSALTESLSASSDGSSETERIRRRALRESLDPRADRFLRCLKDLRSSKVLITSRLLPVALQHGDECLEGIYGHPMTMMNVDDGVELLRALRVTGSDRSLRDIVEACAGYALLLSKLAGRVLKDRPQDRDIEAWLDDHKDFQPWSLEDDLVNKQHHVLEFALGGVGESPRRILENLAVARGPVPMQTVLAKLADDGAGLAAFDAAFADLRDRDLIGFDHTTEQLDLHPLVRARVWASMPDEEKISINRGMVGTLRSEYVAACRSRSLEDLPGAERYFDASLGANQREEARAALKYLDSRVGWNLGDYGRVAEWYDRFVADREPLDWLESVNGSADVAADFANVLITTGRLQDAYNVIAPFLGSKEVSAHENGYLCQHMQFVYNSQGRFLEATEVGLEGVALRGPTLSNNLLYVTYTLAESRHPYTPCAIAAYRTLETHEMSRLMFEAWLGIIEARYLEAESYAKAFHELAESEGVPERRLVALKQWGEALLCQGKASSALEHIEVSRRMARSLGLLWTELQAGCLHAETLLSLGRAPQVVLELLADLELPARRHGNQRALGSVAFTRAKAVWALGDPERTVRFAHEAAQFAWQTGPPLHNRRMHDEICRWLDERDLLGPEPSSEPPDRARLDALDFTILDRISEEAEERLRVAAHEFSRPEDLSETKRVERIRELEMLGRFDEADEGARRWWTALVAADPTSELQALDRLVARGARLDELVEVAAIARTDHLDAIFNYLDYRRLKRYEEARRRGEPVHELPTGDVFDPVDSDEAMEPFAQLEGQALLAEIARQETVLGWEHTTGSSRKWWEAFRKENDHRPMLVLRLVVALRELNATINAFFLAVVDSNTDNIKANLYYLRYRQIREHGEPTESHEGE